MKKNKSGMLLAEEAHNDKTLTRVNSTTKKSTENSESQSFFKLAQMFVIEGALLPEATQMLIEDRTAKRVKLNQLRKQKNIESIIQKTLSYYGNVESKHSMDHDWLSRYIALSEGVSNSTMQNLWAKILAKELAKPGSFSFKALQVFRDMSIYDAKLLAKACSLTVNDHTKNNIRLITGAYQKPGLLNFISNQRQQYINLSAYGLSYADLLALSENNLIYSQESESNLLNKNETLDVVYNGLLLKLTPKKSDVCLQFHRFTPIGTELARLISDNANEDFLMHLQNMLSHFFTIKRD